MVSVPRSDPAVGVQVPLIEKDGSAYANDVTVTDRLDAELVSLPLTVGHRERTCPPSASVVPLPLSVDRRAAEVERRAGR